MPKINLCPPSPFLSPPFLFIPPPPSLLFCPSSLPSSFLFCVCGAGKANSQVLLLLIILSSALCSLPWLCTLCPNPAQLMLPLCLQPPSHDHTVALDTHLFFTQQLQCLRCNCKSLIMSHHHLKTSSSIQLVGHQLQNVGECCGTTAFQ